MEELGRRLAKSISTIEASRPPMARIIYLHGDLGAGKTTLARGIIHGMGCENEVTSPTYTLVEQYQGKSGVIYHFDLYRLGQAEELEYLGVRDMVSQAVLCMFEWPLKGLGHIPKADLEIEILHSGDGRVVMLPAELVGRGRLPGITDRRQTGAPA